MLRQSLVPWKTFACFVSIRFRCALYSCGRCENFQSRQRFQRENHVWKSLVHPVSLSSIPRRRKKNNKYSQYDDVMMIVTSEKAIQIERARDAGKKGDWKSGKHVDILTSLKIQIGHIDLVPCCESKHNNKPCFHLLLNIFEQKSRSQHITYHTFNHVSLFKILIGFCSLLHLFSV